MLKAFNKKSSIALAVTCVVLLIGFYYSLKIYSDMHAEISLSQSETIIFPRGSSIRTLANQLIEKESAQRKSQLFDLG